MRRDDPAEGPIPPLHTLPLPGESLPASECARLKLESRDNTDLVREEVDRRPPGETSWPSATEPQERGLGTQWRPSAVILLLMVQAAVLIASLPPLPPSLPAPPQEAGIAEIERIKSPEVFDELCADMWSSDEKFEACRKKLPVLQNTYRWVDTAALVRRGETLSIDHLGLFYGITGPEDEATRLALAAILGAQCRGGRPPAPDEKTFQQLYLPRCRERLPTLAQMGLVLDVAQDESLDWAELP